MLAGFTVPEARFPAAAVLRDFLHFSTNTYRGCDKRKLATRRSRTIYRTWAVGSGESDRDANAPEIDAIVASRTPIVR
jgi:hypothetical protein